MNLYIDTLVAFMPDSTIDNEGKLVPSETLAAGKDAMICLANYVRTRDTKLLYAAISHACTYMNKDIITTVLVALDKDHPNLNKKASAIYFVEQSAPLLLHSVKHTVDFELPLFVAYLLSAIHDDMQTAYELSQQLPTESK